MKKSFLFFTCIYLFFICANSFSDNVSKKDLFAAAKSAERQGNYAEAKKYYTELSGLSDNPQITSFILKKIDSLDTIKDQAPVAITAVASYDQKASSLSTKTPVDINELTTPIHQARALEEEGKMKEASQLYTTIIDSTSSDNVKNFAKKRIAILLAKENSLKMKKSELEPEVKKSKEIVEPFLSPEQEKEIEEKISKAHFLIQSGDTLYSEGKIEDAFKMYKFAVEALA
jgi:tetratricopeptide (TPR) repeat protein